MHARCGSAARLPRACGAHSLRRLRQRREGLVDPVDEALGLGFVCGGEDQW